MKYQSKLRVAPLVAAAKSLESVYCSDFIHASVSITDLQDQSNFYSGLDARAFNFNIEGIGHGRAVVLINEGSIRLTELTQFTGLGFTFTAFYSSRHGNREVACLLYPLIEAKLVPAIVELL